MSKISQPKYEMAMKQLEELFQVYSSAKNSLSRLTKTAGHLINKMLVIFVTSILEEVNLKPKWLKDKKINELTKPEKYFLALHALRNSIIHNGGYLYFTNKDKLISESYDEVCKEIPELKVELKEQVCIANYEVLRPLIYESINYLGSKRTIATQK